MWGPPECVRHDESGTVHGAHICLAQQRDRVRVDVLNEHGSPGVASVNVRVEGKVCKGYRREHMWDAWARYLPATGANGRYLGYSGLGSAINLHRWRSGWTKPAALPLWSTAASDRAHAIDTHVAQGADSLTDS
jgi:hypothetical protein